MDSNLQVDVADLDGPHRRALEEVMGRELANNQRLIISVTEVAIIPTTTKPVQSLDGWTNVYQGLSEAEIEEIDKIAKTRANLTRNLP
jgi:hypothetical protein